MLRKNTKQLAKIILVVFIALGIAVAGANLASAQEDSSGDEDRVEETMDHIDLENDEVIESIDGYDGYDITAEAKYDASADEIIITWESTEDLNSVSVESKPANNADRSQSLDATSSELDSGSGEFSITDVQDGDAVEIILGANIQDGSESLQLPGIIHSSVDYGSNYTSGTTHTVTLDYVSDSPDTTDVSVIVDQLININDIDVRHRTLTLVDKANAIDYTGPVSFDVGTSQNFVVASYNMDGDNTAEIDLAEDDGLIIEDMNGNEVEVTIEDSTSDDTDSPDDSDDSDEGVVSNPDTGGDGFIPAWLYYGFLAILAIAFALTIFPSDDEIDTLD